MTDIDPPTKARRKKSARFQEIAAQAGVSVATVDRVLNERDSVSDRARRKVLAAARALDVPRKLPQPDHALMHVDILLPRNETPFFKALNAAFRDGAAMLDRRVIVHRRLLPEGDVSAMAEAIRTPPYRRSGVIFAAPDVADIRSAVNDAIQRGEAAVSVVTALADIPGLVYCGMDNRRAGMAAGDLAGRMLRQAGRVIVMGNLALYRGHRERAEGFAEAMQHFAGHVIEVVEPETRDDPDRCYRALRRALSQSGPSVVAVYNTGAGSAGISRVLDGMTGDRPFWIAHEASDDHIALLQSGQLDLAIDQDPNGQAMGALRQVLHAAGVIEGNDPPRRAELRLHTRYTLAR